MGVIPLRAQLVLIAQSLLLGAAAGLLYDVLRVARWRASAGRGLTALCDGLFWLVLLAGLFEFGLIFAIGQGRYYVLAGAAGGMALYFVCLGEGARRALGRLADAGCAAYCRARIVIHWIKDRARRVAPREKNSRITKKFGKASSIFRGKGIK